MLRPIFTAAVLSTLLAVPAMAAPKGMYFSLSRKSPEVSGTMVVDGYTPTEIVSIIRQYCKGGKIGALAYKGKPRKKRGLVLQKFTTSCAGGPHDRFKGKRSGYEVEFITDGEYRNKHLVEITTSDGNGNILYLRETVRP